MIIWTNVMRNEHEYYEKHKVRRRAQARESYKRHQPERLNAAKNYYRNHKHAKKEYDTQYRITNKNILKTKSVKYRQTHANDIYQIHKQYAVKLKYTVISHYSNGKNVCAKCGITDINTLSIDHINGGGTQHKKTITQSFYNYLISHNFPDGYQVLCMNCQAIKIIENNEYGYNHHRPLLNTPKAIDSREYGRIFRAKIQAQRLSFKKMVLTYYGNGKCSCIRCGFNDLRSLSIDHINGGGSRHRKVIGGGSHFYHWLAINNYPRRIPNSLYEL